MIYMIYIYIVYVYILYVFIYSVTHHPPPQLNSVSWPSFQVRI